MPAETPTIRDRRLPVASRFAPNASVRRNPASHRPPRLGARRFPLPSFDSWKKWHCASNNKDRGVARPALPERRPVDGMTMTIACDRNRHPINRFPAVVRRPGPRHVLECCGRPSASICVICGFSVGGLRVFVSLCLRRRRVLFAFLASLRFQTDVWVDL